jgi:hypothetical protein
MALLSSVAFAQRTIDWSVVDILSPTELVSSDQKNTTINLKFVVKNLGPDAADFGDTIVYQVYLMYENGNQILNTNVLYQILFKELKSGDTMHISRSFILPFYAAPNSFKIKFLVVSELWNLAPGFEIKREVPPLTNNNSSKNMVWFNQYKNGVGIEEFKINQLLSVYPNPATHIVNIEWSVINVGSNETVISIHDMQGRLVMQQTVSPIATSEILDISDLNKGIYLVEIQNGEFRTTQKLQVTN